MAQQAFRRHDDERAAVGAQGLQSQQMEVLGGCRTVGDADVVLGAEVEKTLETGARMLGALPFVAMRKQEHETRFETPFRAPRHDELIDDRLADVCEVAELRFPEHESVGGPDAVAVLEAQAGDLRQGAVPHLEPGLIGRDVGERNVVLARLDVVQHRVTLAERTALGVFAAQADRHAVLQQAPEGEGLGVRPVEPVFELLEAALDLAGELREHVEIVGPRMQRPIDPVDHLPGNGRGHVGRVGHFGRPEFHDARAADLAPAVGRGGLLGSRCVGLIVRHLPPRRLHPFLERLDHAIDLLAVDRAVRDEAARPLLAHRRVLVDPLVHARLRVGGLVALVVAVPAIADQVDHDVLAELRPVIHPELDRGEACLRVVGVHVEDGQAKPERQVAGVARRAALVGIGREAELVVGDDVERAARLVALEPAQIDRLRHHALADERRVAVNEHRQDRGTVLLVEAQQVAVAGRRLLLHVLLACRTRHPLDDRVDVLEMTRIRRQNRLDLPAGRLDRLPCTQVVLHIARAGYRRL